MPVDSPSDALRLADSHLRAGRLAEAQAALLPHLEDGAWAFEANNLLGLVALEAGNLEEAETRLRRAIDLKPDHGGARYNLALLLARRGRVGEAVASATCAMSDPALEDRIDQLPGGVAANIGFARREFRTRAVADLATWADRNNYRHLPGVPLPPPPLLSRFRALPDHFNRCLEEIRASYATPPQVVGGEDVGLCFYYVTLGPGYRDETMLPFGRNMDVLADPFWLRYSPLFQRIANLQDHYDFDVKPRHPKRTTIGGEFFFLGGRRIFGHWLGDFLPRLIYLESVPELRSLPLVTPPLAPWQRETLALLGIRNRLVEIDVQDHIGFFRFEKLWLAGELPLPARLEAVRSRFQPARGRREGGRAPAIAYLSRQSQSGRERVANEDEIVAWLESRGVEILYPEKLGIRERIERFRDIDVFVCPPGSANFNYFMFARSDAVMVNLWPGPIFEEGTESWLKGALVYNIPTLDRTVFLLGRFLRDPVGPELLLDVPAAYAVPALAQALDQAVALFESPPSGMLDRLAVVQG